ncbi:MAG: hypothetical protein RLZZ414_2024 [Bacteroidota bacterium]|jgi:hypothetical protein
MREILLQTQEQMNAHIFPFLTLAYEIISFDKEAVIEFVQALLEMFKMLFNLI